MQFPSLQELAERVGGGTQIIPTDSPAQETDIADLERKLRVRFPEDYKQFLKTCGSLLVEVKEELWPRPGPGNIGPHWMQTRFELAVFGVCAEMEWLRLANEADQFRKRNDQPELVPIMSFANTRDCACFAPDGTLVEYMDGYAEPMGGSFTEVLQSYLDEQREYKKELSAKRTKEI